METEYVSAKDGCVLAADYYAGKKKSGVVLLHMMPATRASWRSIAPKFQERGFHVFAIDLRGHGESCGGPEGYRTFSNETHQLSLLDVEAAVDRLRAKGIERVHIAGASIGANLAIEYAAGHAETVSIVLLSPGLDYHGIHADIWVDNMKPHQALLLIASDDDTYSFASTKALFDRASNLPLREVKLLTHAGHGTAMFEAYPALGDELAAWFEKSDGQ